MTADPFSTFLNASRGAHQAVVDRIAERGWESGDGAWDELGPIGIDEWCAAQVSREVLRLLEFAEEMAGLADRCETGDTPVLNRAFVTGKIRGALERLANPSKENPDA